LYNMFSLSENFQDSIKKRSWKEISPLAKDANPQLQSKDA
jgi:hypothetical protein